MNPCQHCDEGQVLEFAHNQGQIRVECPCGASSPWAETFDSAESEWNRINPLPTESSASKRFCEAIIQECSSKHQLHPLEPNLNEDYNLELTFSVKEIKEFLAEHGIITLPEDHLSSRSTGRKDNTL